MIVFKLERERPAMAIYDQQLFYVKDKYLRHYNYQKDLDVPVLGIRKASGINQQHRTLAYNPAGKILTSSIV